jgi:putative hemolysin
MSLVDKKDVARIVKLDRIGMSALAKPIMNILRVSDINKAYDKFAELHGVEFIDAILEEFHTEFEYFENELKRIPKEGPFITISNHPLGALDGIILLKLVSKIRPDFKVMGNFLLEKVEPLKEMFFYVNPFDNKEYYSSYSGVKDALQHLEEGHPLGIFPSGEVSTYQFDEGKVSDRPWTESSMKTIKKAGVPVIPIYFEARNTNFFYLLAMLHTGLRTAKLPSELLKQKNKSIRIRIGKQISVKEQAGYETTDHFTAFLRQRTYLLKEALSPGKRLFSLRRPERQEPIVEPLKPEILQKEIVRLRQSDAFLFDQKNYSVFFAQSAIIPNLLHEIGRLREETFRDVGEGSNKPIDLDVFDYHYGHLILWENDSQQVAGAYRLGVGSEIYKRFGIKGFYVSTLFRLAPEVYPMFSESLEMGRAFIVKEQQQKPLPLFLLWKGIVSVIHRNSELKYITGCASISNGFSRFSKSLMVDYLLKNFGDATLAQHIVPKKPFRSKLDEKYLNLVEESTPEDLQKIDRLIGDVEPGELRIPVLIKKYLKQNAKIVCFNVDPLFNDSLDGFMYIRIEDLPDETLNG